jgi:hypothetical protein
MAFVIVMSIIGLLAFLIIGEAIASFEDILSPASYLLMFVRKGLSPEEYVRILRGFHDSQVYIGKDYGKTLYWDQKDCKPINNQGYHYEFIAKKGTVNGNPLNIRQYSFFMTLYRRFSLQTPCQKIIEEEIKWAEQWKETNI